ncbi:Na(+)/Cl(-) betaine/GABA transporter [Intoshia linei]|uniref:Transporter n=1 Tax=Intoshia linei TaxID=1819745 RepID=A0A177BAD7_9BILA|nr:Na(+)/Cl(-) betaine/GABA transporter [Intoshia linei]
MTKEYWGNQLEFILSCVGYAVGVGNIWRFPYICLRNGGGAFLIPYFIFLILCGIPLFYIELSLGQYSKKSPIKVWDLCPIFKGLGIGMIVVSGILTIYYNIIMTWTIYYLYQSMSKILPWSTCDNPWNTPNCVNFNGTRYNHTSDSISPSEEYFNLKTLNISDGIENMGPIQVHLIVCLLIAWLLCFLCLMKGIKSSGKVVYITVIIPYILLTSLLIRSVMLPGAYEGIKYYLTPDFKRLLEFQVWIEACIQIFYSLGPAWGGLITLSSYNKFNNNILRDSILIPLINCGTSFYAGFVIFSIVGYMSHKIGSPISETIASGPGLAFVAYPMAVSMMPLAPLWAIIFFIMMLFLGIDSQFGMIETLTSGLMELMPKLFGKRRQLLTGIVCILWFIIGISMTTKGGMYVFSLMDWYCGTFSVLIIAFCECIVIAWIYDYRRLFKQIKHMNKIEPSVFWIITWRFITPIIMAGMLVATITQMKPPMLGKYSFPTWAIAIGWILSMASVVPIPIRIKINLKPNENWLKIEKDNETQLLYSDEKLKDFDDIKHTEIRL